MRLSAMVCTAGIQGFVPACLENDAQSLCELLRGAVRHRGRLHTAPLVPEIRFRRLGGALDLGAWPQLLAAVVAAAGRPA